MIPKASILRRAEFEDLRPTTVEKDYVLGWILYGISQHVQAREWVFKGGTSLKKCFFNTYRFSEDLDFTIPAELPYTNVSLSRTLREITEWVESESGIGFPNNGISIDEYSNRRGNTSFQAKVSFAGPLQMPRRELQRIKFDITNDEVIADNPIRRAVNHPYEDERRPAPEVLCYSVNEILAEKSRALYERQGRARDLYDVVHIARVFRESVDVNVASRVVREKFSFKQLPEPTVDLITDRVNADLLRANWADQLTHQLPALPNVDGFLESLRESLSWWLESSRPTAHTGPIPGKQGERVAARVTFARSAVSHRLGIASPSLERIIYAARNRLCIKVTYKGVSRTVEPYSLRYPQTGNTLLYVWERDRGGVHSNRIKAYNVSKIEGVDLTSLAYTPRFVVEL